MRRGAGRGRKIGTVAGKSVAVMLSVVVLGVSGFLWHAEQQAQGLGASSAISEKPKAPDGSQNILLLGLTTRLDKNGNLLPPDVLAALHAGSGRADDPSGQDQTGGYNTNTMILLHVPNDGSRVTGISIPRDSWVKFVDGPLYGMTVGKIKEAYGLARAAEFDKLRGEKDQATREFKAREAGRKSTIRNLESLLDVHIDHFAEVSLEGFWRVANALDGIDVCLKHDTSDPKSGANFTAGKHTLDGTQALAFVRQRDNVPGDDLGRESRQQAYLAAVALKLKSGGVFGSLSSFNKLFDAARDSVVYDNGWDIGELAMEAKNLNPGNILFKTLPTEGPGTYTYGNGRKTDMMKIDPDKFKAVTRALLNPQPAGPASPGAPAPTPVLQGGGSTVHVRNNSGADGLAGELSTALAAHGFTKGMPSGGGTQATSKIYYGSGAKHDADTLAKALGIRDPIPSSQAAAANAAPAGSVLIVLGKDFGGIPDSLKGGGSAPPPADQPTRNVTPADTTKGGAEVHGGDQVPCVD